MWSCSVEKLDSEDHDVVGDRTQDDFTMLGPMFPGPQGRAEQPLEHAVDGLDLPPLTVFLFVEVGCHAAAPVTAGKFVRRSPALRRDDRSHAVRLASVLVSRLAVVAGIGEQRLDRRAAGRLLQCQTVMLVVRPRANSGNDRQNHMTGTIADEARLGKAATLPPLVFPGFLAPFRVVRADVPTLEARAVDGRQLHSTLHQFGFHRAVDRFVEQLPGGHRNEQSPGRFLEGRIVRDPIEFDRPGKARRIGQQRSQLAIVQLQEFLQHQAGKQLRLRELLRTEAVRVRAQPAATDLIGGQQHSFRRFARLAHTWLYVHNLASSPLLAPGFLQSTFRLIDVPNIVSLS